MVCTQTLQQAAAASTFADSTQHHSTPGHLGCTGPLLGTAVLMMAKLLQESCCWSAN